MHSWNRNVLKSLFLLVEHEYFCIGEQVAPRVVFVGTIFWLIRSQVPVSENK